MRVAVLTLTRDRLEYTKACFASLRENAGCDYNHYVYDNGSKDGTRKWLFAQSDLILSGSTGNKGYAYALNHLLRKAESHHDLLVTFDNDCLVKTPGTLKAVAEATLEADKPLFLSPLILGLRHRPSIIQTVGRIGKTAVVGGIFRSIPPQAIRDGFRFNEDGPLCGDEGPVIEYCARMGGWCGYLLDYEAEHYLTTDGQHADIPWYFERRVREGGPAG